MSTSLSSLTHRLGDERRAFMEVLDALGPEQRRKKPSKQAWSPAEIAEHVYNSEAGVVRGIQRQVDPNGERRELGRPSALKFAALITALGSTLKFKVPPGATAMVPAGTDYEEIREQWSGFDGAWEGIVLGFPAELEDVGLIKHPVIGPMTLSQSIRFLTAHAARHFKQLERTVKLISV